MKELLNAIKELLDFVKEYHTGDIWDTNIMVMFGDEIGDVKQPKTTEKLHQLINNLKKEYTKIEEKKDERKIKRGN